jgi:hypothetical protein
MTGVTVGRVSTQPASNATSANAKMGEPKHFPAKHAPAKAGVPPVRRKKCDKNKKLEPRSDSNEPKRALASLAHALGTARRGPTLDATFFDCAGEVGKGCLQLFGVEQGGRVRMRDFFLSQALKQREA